MKKILYLFLLLNYAIISSIKAQIHTIQTIKEVMAYLSPNDSQIVVFDIDNTLLRAPSDLGSDQWVGAIAKQNITNGMSYLAAWNQILPIYFHIQNYINLVPTEPDIANSIQAIEQLCKHTICLTARSSAQLITITCEQLAKNNLNFQVPEIDHTRLNLPGDSIYQQGVLFCGHNCKGQVLVSFLQACHFKPSEIILIDDKLYNLESVEKQLANYNIKFTGLRYAGCDELVSNLDMTKATQELDVFLLQYPIT